MVAVLTLSVVLFTGSEALLSQQMAMTSCPFVQLQAEQVTTSLSMAGTFYPAPQVQAEFSGPTIPRHQPGSSRWLYEGADGMIQLKPFVCSPTTGEYSRQVGMS